MYCSFVFGYLFVFLYFFTICKGCTIVIPYDFLKIKLMFETFLYFFLLNNQLKPLIFKYYLHSSL